MKKQSYLLMVLIFALLFGQLYSTKYAKTTLSKMINSSTHIVEGEVTSVESYWRTPEKNSIYTSVTIKIDEKIKGDLQETVTVTLRGGKIGEFGEEIDDTPEFKIGDEGVFFLISHREKFWIHSMSLGYYQIQEDDQTGSKILYNKLGTSVVENDLSLSKIQSETFQVKYKYTEFVQSVKVLVKNAEGK